MARSGFLSVLRALNQVSKEIDRNNRRQARIRAQQLKAEEREQRQQERELAASLREEERLRRQQERDYEAQNKAAIQAFVQAGQEALAARCRDRATARDSVLQEIYS